MTDNSWCINNGYKPDGDPEGVIQLKFRRGYTCETNLGVEWNWGFTGSGSDIIEWRFKDDK